MATKVLEEFINLDVYDKELKSNFYCIFHVIILDLNNLKFNEAKKIRLSIAWKKGFI